MKIVYLTDQIYLHGGVEKVLSQKANYFSEISGDDVTIITYNQLGKVPVYQFSDKIKMIDLGVNYEITKSYFHPENLRRTLNHHQLLKNILQNLKPDVAVSCSIGPDFFFLPFICKEIPKIKEYHATRYFTSQIKSVKKFLMNRLTAFVEKSYSQLVILNEDEKIYYNDINVSVIPNPAELDCMPSNLSSKKIISAGRITYQKNFEDLILIGQLLLKDFPDWQIHIYGDDYLGRQNILQEQIDHLQLSNSIKFKGVSEDLKTTFLDYSIYAMTSNHETFPMVLLEALSVGLPVVSYDCPTGPSRIITDQEDSFLIKYKDRKEFAAKLKLLMQNEDLRKVMGEKGRLNVQRFSIEKVMILWKYLFHSLSTPK